MKKKHPIKRFFLLLLLVVLVAALAVMPMLTANQETQEETASILNDTAALRDITRFLSYGAPIEKSHQQKDQNVIRQVEVDGLNHFEQCIHVLRLLLE